MSSFSLLLAQSNQGPLRVLLWRSMLGRAVSSHGSHLLGVSKFDFVVYHVSFFLEKSPHVLTMRYAYYGP